MVETRLGKGSRSGSVRRARQGAADKVLQLVTARATPRESSGKQGHAADAADPAWFESGAAQRITAQRVTAQRSAAPSSRAIINLDLGLQTRWHL